MTLAIIGFVLSIISAFINPFAIISIISLCVCGGGLTNPDGSKNGLAIAGMVIGSIATAYNLAILLIL